MGAKKDGREVVRHLTAVFDCITSPFQLAGRSSEPKF